MELINITCYLSNLHLEWFCDFGTEKVANFDHGKRMVKMPLNIAIAGYEIELWQDYDFMMEKNLKKFRGTFVQSTKLHIKNVSKDKIDEIKTIAFELASLFSFATDSQVSFYKYESQILCERWNSRSHYSNYSPVFQGTANIKNFVEECWPRYNQLKELRKLHGIVDLLVSIDALPLYHEIELVTIFITLENLKYTYALDKGYYFDEFFFRDSSKKERLGFEKLLTEMFCDCSMEVDLEDIVTLRNDIIHSCLSSMTYEKQDRILLRCKEIVREYFLRLVGYSGSYRSCVDVMSRRI